MGVPAFFRWLQRNYPLIISNCIEDPIEDEHDLSKPNRNTSGDEEFDCLYLDVNGIIHPCFHSDDPTSPPKAEQEVFDAIDNYIKRIFNIVRPRKLLFMAIDGPAPRAKMNQQRARRFKAAKDSAYAQLLQISKLKKEKKDCEELKILEDKNYFEKRDSNVITPGTGFMHRLGIHLNEFIKKQQKEFPAWADIDVILSDSSVPGEGEHKIMDFIRGQRLQSLYDQNRKHCIYGLDADLLFLGLMTHEFYFTVIREKVLENVDGFHFVNLWVFRQFLEKELKPTAPLKFEWNFEKAIEDLIFLCFTVGNDFLPVLPGMNIAAGTINTIIAEYSQILPKFNGFIIENGIPDYSRFVEVMKQLVKYEKKEIENILSPSEIASKCQIHINEICNTEKLELCQMTVPVLGDHKQQKPPSIKDQLTRATNEMKEKYYKTKFGDDVSPEQVATDYFKGMYWVYQYYSHGCPSWSWYYPYQYAPLLSTLTNIHDLKIDWNFEYSEPLKPLIQLMAVLPPQSAHCLPHKMGQLMTDKSSPIISFYPKKFTVDLIGGTTLWKGVVNIPFIDPNELEKAVNSIDLELTEEEKNRNTFSVNKVYMKPTDETTIQGPIFWGKVKHIQDNEYILESIPKVEKNQELAFLLMNIRTPPCVTTIPFDPFARNKKRLGNTAIKSKVQTGDSSFNLAIPGYPQGATPDFRNVLLTQRSKKTTIPKSKVKKSSAFLF